MKEDRDYVRLGRYRLSRRRFITLVLGSGLAVLSGYGLIETVRISITRINLDLGSKIAFLTDNHIHSYGYVQKEIVDIISREDPDIIFMAGDLVDELTRDLSNVEKFIGELDAREKYAVMGNHEYWSGLVKDAKEILEGNGFKVLFDEYIDTSVGRVLGINWREDRRYPEVNTDGLVIVHDPNAADSIEGNAFVLAGHTHGGLMLGPIPIITNARYTRGYYQFEGGTVMYVSRGLGQMIPVRPTSPLEMVIIE